MLVMFFGASIFCAPMLVGCDREVAHEETVKTHSDGSTEKKETTVKEKPDGTIVKEQEHQKTNP
jgi:hypothetical protein